MLELVVAGKSSRDVAEMLDISVKTVKRFAAELRIEHGRKMSGNLSGNGESGNG